MKKKITETELKAAATAAVRDSVGYYGSEVSSARESALKYYRGDEYGDEREGWSKVVTRDVLDTVEWILPSLIKTFTAGDDVVEYIPEGPEDEEMAEQATDYVNHVFYKDNPGFMVLYTWFKDALLQKVGIVKRYWSDEKKTVTEEYGGLDEEQYILIASEDDVEVLEHTANDDGSHDMKIERTVATGRVVVDNIPPEEFLISSRSRDLDDAPFVAHRVRKTKSELLAEGYSRAKVNRLGFTPSDETGRTGERETRYDDEDGDRDDYEESQRAVWLVEGYLKIDVNKDGLSEMVKVDLAGDDSYELLRWEEVDGHPFRSLCPIPIPHKFYGLSVADLVMDIQRITSTLMRQTLDNLYLSNNPEREVNLRHLADGALPRLTSPVPGNIIPVKESGAVMPLSVPFVAGHTFPMLEMLAGMKEDRTGVMKAPMDADALQNQSATANNNLREQAAQRIELIARIFAETGVKGLFRDLLRLSVKHQDRARVIRLRNKWVEMDPRGFNAEMDASINVGLGHGRKDQALMYLNNILQHQATALANGGLGLVTPKHVYNTLEKIVRESGLKSVEPYFSDPGDGPMPQGPNPAMAKVEAEAQAKQAEMQMDAQMEARKSQQDAAIALEKLSKEMEMRRQQMAAEYALKREQLEKEMELKRQQMAWNAATDATMAPVRFGGAVG